MPVGPGETLERYAIEALIGRGGMGEVYRATDTRLRRRVALKILRADKERPDAVARLFREARAAAALSHPNAVALHDAGEAEGVFYLVMELVSGEPLLAYVGDDRASTPKKIGWLVDVARALAAAHRAGIVHRDVKPSNVMVSEDGFAKVLDFGLARPIDSETAASFRTQEGRVLGTLRYMAPEQLAGAPADDKSDQYAFGLTAYELLAGTHPGGALVDAPPPPLGEAAPEVPAAVAAVVMRALERSPDARHASMDELVLALESAAITRREKPPSPAREVAGAEPSTVTATSETLASLASLAAAAATPPPKRAPAAAPTTLISKEAPSALVRARDLARLGPRGAAAPRRRVATVVISIAVLALAAWAGNCFGSRHRDPAPSPPASAAPY